MYTSSETSVVPKQIREGLTRWYGKYVPPNIRENISARHDSILALLSMLSIVLTLVFHVEAYKFYSGVGLTLMWIMHESGHVIACQLLGIRVRWIWFIPFVGAIMRTLDGGLRDRNKEAIVGIAGPIMGLVGTTLCFLFWRIIEQHLSLDVAKITIDTIAYSCLYNVLQMVITSRPFDGGRVTQIVHPLSRLFGWVFMLLLTLYLEQTWVAAFWILLITDLRFRFQLHRLYLMSVMFVVLISGITYGYGREVWWQNAADLFVAGLGLLWAYGEFTRDKAPYHLLPEWRLLLRLYKLRVGTWVERKGDRRASERQSNGKRVSSQVVVPRIQIESFKSPPQFADRRKNEERQQRRRKRVILIRIGWLLGYCAVLILLAVLYSVVNQYR